jgi:hypothetical protein
MWLDFFVAHVLYVNNFRFCVCVCKVYYSHFALHTLLAHFFNMKKGEKSEVFCQCKGFYFIFIA